MKKKGHVIKSIKKDSIAEAMELEAGDLLLSINGNEIEDVFDYEYFIQEEQLELLIQKENGEEWELEIEKDETEDLGIEFEQGLMDEYRSCKNQCMFCFIDQMPPGMRKTLYFKDDDSRLSFLQGNYVTLTNMSKKDIERIIAYKLSPINISVHTTNKELRKKMLKNRFAGDALEKINQLFLAGVEMNSQIVLCKGYNDGAELDHTIKDLSQYIPHMKSLSVVPVGLTKYRDNLVKLERFEEKDAKEVLEMIEKWQKKCLDKYGTRFVYASDEWYLTAKIGIPEEECYEGFSQLENGVGMIRSLVDEVSQYLKQLSGDERQRKVSIATGLLAASSINMLTKAVREKFPNVHIFVYPIKNEFFGEDITVTGLLTGSDLIKQLADKELGDRLLLSKGMIRGDEPILLDDITVKELENTLQIPIDIVQSDGKSFVDQIIQ